MKKRKTPLQQLLPLLTARQKHIILPALCELKVDTAEDLCLSLVAYIRFGLHRKYDSMFINVLYQSFIDLISHPEHYKPEHSPMHSGKKSFRSAGTDACQSKNPNLHYSWVDRLKA